MANSAASNSIVSKYYNENQRVYSFFSKDCLHYGFWNNDTKEYRESLMNTIRFVADCLEVNKKDIVLDAGCGTGGSSIFFAKIGSKCKGITLSKVQLKIANENARDAGVSDLIEFSIQDYTNTNFADNTFSKVFGLESICYAERKIDFLKEAYRLLKKGGKICVCDGFLTKKESELNQKEKKYYEGFLKGWALPNLAVVDEFRKDMEKVGFKNVKYYDKKIETKKTSRRIHRVGVLSYPFSFLLSNLRLIPKSTHGHTIACVNQKYLLENCSTYGVFAAEK